MRSFREFVFAAMIPVNLLMILWMWLGRGLFGATLGWMAAFMLFTAVPLLLILLTITTVLAFQQPGKPRLSTASACTQVGLWSIMLVFGAVVVDVDDGSPEESVLINLIGWSPETLGFSLQFTAVLAGAALVCWVCLAALLIAGLKRRRPAATPVPR